MIKVTASSRWLAFAAALCLQVAAGRDHLFDLKIRDGQAFEEKEFAGLLPTPVFDIRSDNTLDSLEKTRKEAPEGTARGKLNRSRDHIYEEFPGDDMIGRVDYNFVPGGVGLRKICLITELVVPSRGRLERFYGVLARLLGPPQRIDREILYGKPDRQTLNFTWEQDGNRLILRLQSPAAYFNVELNYYPGEANPNYIWVRDNSQEEISNDPAALLKAYLDQVRKLPAGDGPPAPVAAAADEQECFLQYHEANSLHFGRKWRVADKPQLAVLSEALARRYKPLGDKKTCEHLLRIIQGKDPKIGNRLAHFGAEQYLASLQTPEAIPCLFEVLRPESGLVTGAAAKGLAAHCQGDVLDQVIRMLEAGGQSTDQAIGILMSLSNPTLREGAERRVSALKSTTAKERAVWALRYSEGISAEE